MKKNHESQRRKFKTAYCESICDTVLDIKNTKTQQQFRDDSEIYNILRRHTKGLPVPSAGMDPIYTDLTDFNPSTNSSRIENLKNTLSEQQKELAKKLEIEEIEKHEKLAEKLKLRKEENDKKQQTTQNPNNQNNNQNTNPKNN